MSESTGVAPTHRALRPSEAPVREVRLYPEEAAVTRRYLGRRPPGGIASFVFPLAPDVDPTGATAKVFLQRRTASRAPSSAPDRSDRGRDPEAPSTPGPDKTACPVGDPIPVEVLGLFPASDRGCGRTSDLDHEEYRLEAEAADDDRRRRFLEHHARLARRLIADGWVSASPPIETWSAFFDRYRRETTQLAEASSRRRARRAEIERERASKNLEGPPPRVGVRLRIPPVRSASEGPGASASSAEEEALVIDLTYRTGLATWKPSYDLRVEPEPSEPGRAPRAARVEIVLVANVEQRTGEDWSDVRLRLLRAPVPEPMGPPHLGRLVVSGFQGPPASPVEGPEPRRPVEGPRSLRPPAHTPAAPAFIPTGAAPTRIELFGRSMEARLAYHLLTEGPAVAWRVAEGQAPIDLPDGPGTVLWMGSFGGMTRIPATAAGESLRLEIGVEPGLVVERTDRRPPPRRSRGTNRLEHRFEVTLEVKDEGLGAVDLEVRSRLPVAGSSDIEVEIHELPPGTVVDRATGFARSVLRLAAGGRRSTRHAFSIHAPRTVVVDGPEPR